MRGLYPIVDLDTLARRGISPIEFAERALEARPAMLQLRAKNTAADETLQVLRRFLPLCRKAGTLLFANDRPDLAVLAEVDGVHVGQYDLPVTEVRRFAANLKVGVSTHDLAQFEAALRAAPDYIAFGPIFTTLSKENPDPIVGLEALAAVVEKARVHAIPVVAIGGITLERAAAIRNAGALGAVIGALLPPGSELEEVSKRAKDLQRALGGDDVRPA